MINFYKNEKYNMKYGLFMETIEYLKSAFNYTGQKYKILDKIYKFFPRKNEVDVFVDLFCGGGSVFINSDYNKIIANDKITPLINFYKEIQTVETYDELKNNLGSYILDKEDKDAYMLSRKKFNDSGAVNPYHFFCLLQSCTNNMMRFNKNYMFNQTFGKRTFNTSTDIKLKSYFDRIKTMNVKFTNMDYKDFLDKLLETKKNDNIFVYLDPPYLITEAGYNSYWSKDLEVDMYKYLDILNENGIKFLMSNVSKHKGVDNPHMDKIEKYNIVEIEHDYDKVSRSDNKETQEIIVKNF